MINSLKLLNTGRSLGTTIAVVLTMAVFPQSRSAEAAEAVDALEAGELIENVAPTQADSARVAANMLADRIEQEGIKRVRYPNAFTLSPLHAAVLLSVEASYERMLSHHVGVVGTLGAGTLPSLFGALRVRPGLDLQEVGAQVRWYPRRQERWNPHLGVEGFWGRADYREDHSDDDSWLVLDFSQVWTAWGGGPFVGTKFIGYGGVVVDVQAGAQLLRITDQRGNIDHQWWPIVNVNVGKGF